MLEPKHVTSQTDFGFQKESHRLQLPRATHVPSPSPALGHLADIAAGSYLLKSHGITVGGWVGLRLISKGNSKLTALGNYL